MDETLFRNTLLTTAKALGATVEWPYEHVHRTGDLVFQMKRDPSRPMKIRVTYRKDTGVPPTLQVEILPIEGVRPWRMGSYSHQIVQQLNIYGDWVVQIEKKVLTIAKTMHRSALDYIKTHKVAHESRIWRGEQIASLLGTKPFHGTEFDDCSSIMIDSDVGIFSDGTVLIQNGGKIHFEDLRINPDASDESVLEFFKMVRDFKWKRK